MTLLCVPHLAGNPAMFSGWSAALAPDVAVVPAELPGRGRRVGERPLTSIAAIVDDLASHYRTLWSGSFAFYGHSMGAIVAYELTRLLSDLGTRPAALIVGASRAPQEFTDARPTIARSDAGLIDYLRSQSGTPEAVFESPELAALVLRDARADLEAWETYVAHAGTPLATPITVLGGTRDPGVQRSDLELWRALTSGSFEVAVVDGDHFFAQQAPSSVIEVVRRALRSGSDTGGGDRAIAAKGGRP
jgi:medium-chain acyl-[acyl-carrier-protein] hydrolase